jgi:hypothetical protein
MIWSKESKAQKLKNKSKADYEKALKLAASPARDSVIFCVRISLRCRANLDAAFAKAASDIARYEELALIAIAKGNEPPLLPVADPFQLVKSGGEFIYTYIPERFAEKVFAVGAAYQTLKISRAEAIGRTQAIANDLGIELGLRENFEVLRFLRDEEGAETAATAGDSEHGSPPGSSTSTVSE